MSLLMHGDYNASFPTIWDYFFFPRYNSRYGTVLTGHELHFWDILTGSCRYQDPCCSWADLGDSVFYPSENYSRFYKMYAFKVFTRFLYKSVSHMITGMVLHILQMVKQSFSISNFSSTCCIKNCNYYIQMAGFNSVIPFSSSAFINKSWKNMSYCWLNTLSGKIL